MEGIQNAKLLLTDLDGVLTDGTFSYHPQNTYAKCRRYNVKDGMGFSLFQKKGIKCGVITGDEGCDFNQRFIEDLELDFLRTDCYNKLMEVERICNLLCISLDEVIYIGDANNDEKVLKAVGFPFIPFDGQLYLRRYEKVERLKCMGGEGVILHLYNQYFRS